MRLHLPGTGDRVDTLFALQSPREKRKVGRPIIYSGDPDAPDLTPQERRRIRRRIANRESARRVRAKRQDLIEEMSIKVKRFASMHLKRRISISCAVRCKCSRVSNAAT